MKILDAQTSSLFPAGTAQKLGELQTTRFICVRTKRGEVVELAFNGLQISEVRVRGTSDEGICLWEKIKYEDLPSELRRPKPLDKLMGILGSNCLKVARYDNGDKRLEFFLGLKGGMQARRQRALDQSNQIKHERQEREKLERERQERQRLERQARAGRRVLVSVGLIAGGITIGTFALSRRSAVAEDAGAHTGNAAARLLLSRKITVTDGAGICSEVASTGLAAGLTFGILSTVALMGGVYFNSLRKRLIAEYMPIVDRVITTVHRIKCDWRIPEQAKLQMCEEALEIEGMLQRIVAEETEEHALSQVRDLINYLKAVNYIDQLSQHNIKFNRLKFSRLASYLGNQHFAEIKILIIITIAFLPLEERSTDALARSLEETIVYLPDLSEQKNEAYFDLAQLHLEKGSMDRCVAYMSQVPVDSPLYTAAQEVISSIVDEA